MIVCTACGRQNRVDFRFCQECGKALGGDSPVRLCVQCGAEVELTYRFCGQCGGGLADVDASQAPLTDRAPTAEANAAVPATGVSPAADAAEEAVEQAGAPGGEQQDMGATILEKSAFVPPSADAASGPEPVSALAAAGSATVIPQSAIAAMVAPAPEVTPDMELQPAAEVAPVAMPVGDLAPEPAAVPVVDLAPEPAAVPVAEIVSDRVAAPVAVASGAEGNRPRLVQVLHDGSDGDSFPVSGDLFDVGRIAGQRRFAGDPYLSERHCRFERRGDDWYAIDLNAQNGVYLRLRAPHFLGDREYLLAGTHLFVFGRVVREEYELAPAMEQGVMLFGSPLNRPWGCLRVLTTAGVFRDVRYLYRPELVLGREAADWSFMDDEFMSRRHLALSLVEGKPQVRDLGSSNGTFVRFKGEMKLRSGDTVRLGNQLLRFER